MLGPVDYIVFDRRQNALKICANSVYGMMGIKNSKYFGHVACAESVTTVGRVLLADIVKEIQQSYPVKVIYGDTDSCKLCHNDKSKDEVVKLGVQICNDVTSRLPEPMALKFECYCEKIMLLTKKRYVLVSDGKVSYKGGRNWEDAGPGTAQLAVLVPGGHDSRMYTSLSSKLLQTVPVT